MIAGPSFGAPATSALVTRSRYAALPLGMPGSAAAAVTVVALALDVLLGPILIAAAMALWAAVGALRPREALSALLAAGVVPWLVPAWALLSTFWSAYPEVTLRAAAQLVVTTAFALWCARALPARGTVWVIFLVFLAVCAASVVQDNQYYDHMAGRVSSAGIYANKNLFATAGSYLALAGAVLAFDPRGRPAGRAIAAGGAALGAASCASAYSVAMIVLTAGGLLVIGTAAISLVLRPDQRPAFFELAAVAGVALASVGAAVAVAFWSEFLALFGKDPTLTGRTLLWHYGGRFIDGMPPLGHGFAAFWVQGQPLAEEMWRMQKIASRKGFSFHGLYYDIVLQLSYVGLALAVATMAAAAWRTYAWARLCRTFEPVFFLAAVLVCVAAQWQHSDLFLAFGFNHFVLVAALGHASLRNDQP